MVPAPGATYELQGDAKELAVIRESSLFGGWVDPANADVYDPRDRQRVPTGGAWAMITRRLPPMERGLDEKLRVGRVFFVQHEASADEFGFLPDGRYRVDCDSPWGSLKLWPYEYSVLPPERLVGLWQDGALRFNPTNIELAQFNNVVFYVRSRGIGLADAAVMALGSFTGPIGWFEPATEELAADLEDMEYRIHAPLTAPFHQERRRAARERMKEQL